MEMRQGLMSEESSVGRESAWEKKFWRAGDSDGDERIGFDELKRLCHRINVNAPEAELRNLFQVRCPLWQWLGDVLSQSRFSS
jgi:phosphatidylinositol phospholipase C delta